MGEMILRLDKKDSGALGAVRCITGLRAAEDEESVWLRGITGTTGTGKEIKQLPVKSTFVLDEQHRLFIPGTLTPIGLLKEMEWQPLSSFIPVNLPVSAMPGKTNEQVPVRLVPSDTTKSGDVLLTRLAGWKTYAETAAAARLSRLRFAVSAANEVLVWGHPLPPLPGREYWLQDDILLPAGYRFEISLAAGFASHAYNKTGDSLLLFHPDGNWQKIAKSCFVTAKRSAVRLTKQNSTGHTND
ncbi:MAG: hypothetical protein ABW019_07850 [Chitinophagaceae bacterium]